MTVSLISDVSRDVKRDIKTAMKLRPPWWSVLAVSLAAFFAYPLFDDAGKVQLMIPIVASAAVLGTTIVTKWRLRAFAWFWSTMALLAALHILLILYVPWTSNWVPAVVSAAVASLDAIMMLSVVDAIARLMKPTSH